MGPGLRQGHGSPLHLADRHLGRRFRGALMPIPGYSGGRSGDGAGGSAAFGGVAPVHAPDAAQSLAVYLFSPIVEDHEVLDWELRATERDAAVPAVPAVPAVSATYDAYSDVAGTLGVRLTLLDPTGAAGKRMDIRTGAQRRRHPVRECCGHAAYPSGRTDLPRRHPAQSDRGCGECRRIRVGSVFRWGRCSDHHRKRFPDPDRRRRSFPRGRRRSPRGPGGPGRSDRRDGRRRQRGGSAAHPRHRHRGRHQGHRGRGGRAGERLSGRHRCRRRCLPGAALDRALHPRHRHRRAGRSGRDADRGRSPGGRERTRRGARGGYGIRDRARRLRCGATGSGGRCEHRPACQGRRRGFLGCRRGLPGRCGGEKGRGNLKRDGLVRQRGCSRSRPGRSGVRPSRSRGRTRCRGGSVGLHRRPHRCRDRQRRNRDRRHGGCRRQAQPRGDGRRGRPRWSPMRDMLL